MSIAGLILASGRDADLIRLEVASGRTWLEGYRSARWNDMHLAALAVVLPSATRAPAPT